MKNKMCLVMTNLICFLLKIKKKNIQTDCDSIRH